MQQKDSENIIEQTVAENAETQECAETAEINDDKYGININKMNKEQLKTLAGALIEENVQMENELKALQEENKKLSEAAKKAKMLSGMYTELSNDFNNYRRRNADLEKESKEKAAAEIALGIFPVYDNFKLALQKISGKADKEGIEIIFRQFTEALNNLGIKEMDCKGEIFDPQKHSALMAEETDDENLKGRIKEVYSSGYYYKDKVIKQSQVVVYK